MFAVDRGIKVSPVVTGERPFGLVTDARGSRNDASMLVIADGLGPAIIANRVMAVAVARMIVSVRVAVIRAVMVAGFTDGNAETVGKRWRRGRCKRADGSDGCGN